ncbi:MAG: hypothetical protein L0Y35_05590, partial [Flammeovirgaceae bacterium]|nr:hypothetical protein [Flammeovirgaceae bacterium]
MKYLFALSCLFVFQAAFSTDTNPSQPQTLATLSQQYTQLNSDVEIMDGCRMAKMFKVEQF